MDRSLLLVAIGGELAALDTAVVRSVVELEAITPVSRAPRHIVGLAALRSRAMTVVDCRRALELPATDGFEQLAVVVELEGFLYALQVDGVEDVVSSDCDAAEIRARLLPGWARVSTGMVETSSGPVLLLDPVRLIEGPPERKAA